MITKVTCGLPFGFSAKNLDQSSTSKASPSQIHLKKNELGKDESVRKSVQNSMVAILGAMLFMMGYLLISGYHNLKK